MASQQLDRCIMQFEKWIETTDYTKMPIGDVLPELENRYTKVLLERKSVYPQLHKSLIFMKRFLRTNITVEQLNELHIAIVAYFELPDNPVRTENLVRLVKSEDFFYQRFERQLDLITPSFYARNRVANAKKIEELTPEISNENDEVFIELGNATF